MAISQPVQPASQSSQPTAFSFTSLCSISPRAWKCTGASC
jgi:hypothetical protein